MPLKRLAVCTAAFLFSIGLAGSAHAAGKAFSLTGGGGQLHIGNGLQLPIQQAATAATTGTAFPTLLVPVKAGVPPIVTGTIAKPKLVAGPKSGYQRKLSVPVGVLSKPAAQKRVGVLFSNPTVYAVATNIKFVWPAAAAVFTTAGLGPSVINGFGGTMTYSNTLGARFGGAAQFALSPGAAAGLYPSATEMGKAEFPVTIYAKPDPGGATTPCTHPSLGGSTAVPNNAGCAGAMLLALPTGNAAAGAAYTVTVTTPGVKIAGKNVAILKIGGAPPSGNILIAALAAINTAVPTNAATSQAGPWTTGKVIISNTAAEGGTEVFTLSGKDSRTAYGGGTIQMVSGSLSTRVTTGANANRGWLRLTLSPLGQVPSISMPGLAAMVSLMLLGFGYATRRRMLK